MRNRYKIALSASLVLALFYALPWIALSEQVRLAGYNRLIIPVVPRVLHLFCTVFCTSLLYFQYNLFWKHKFNIAKRFDRICLNLTVNALITIVISAVLIVVARWLFAIGAPKAYFTFYFFRNASICVVVILITYTIELIQRLQQEKFEVLMLKHQNTETELTALRSQIDSHFLFNTLTTLSSLARENSPHTAAFVDHLSDSFRYTLEKREHKLVTVREELHFLESYIFMMKHRLHDGMQVLVNVDAALGQRNIPQFAIQTGVENAIKHNIISSKQMLVIELISVGNAIMIRNKLQRKRGVSGSGIGLANLSQRYRLIAKQDISVKVNEDFFELYLPIL